MKIDMLVNVYNWFSRGKELSFAAFANFFGVNTSTTAYFM